MTVQHPTPEIDTTAFKPAGQIVLRRIGDESLLVPVSGTAAQSNRIYPLNATGAAIWEALVRGDTFKEIATEISRSFDVATAQAETDCRAFIDALIQEELLEPGA